MQSTAYTQGGSSVNRFSKRGASLSPEREYNTESHGNLNKANFTSIGSRSMAGNTRIMSSKGPRNNLLNYQSTSKVVIGGGGINSNAYGGGVSQTRNAGGVAGRVPIAEMKRPKSSGNYSKKMKYRQWGQHPSMRSNNQLDFNNYNSQSRTNMNTCHTSAHGVKHPLTLNKEISETSIQVGHQKNVRPRTSGLNRSMNAGGNRRLKSTTKFMSAQRIAVNQSMNTSMNIKDQSALMASPAPYTSASKVGASFRTPVKTRGPSQLSNAMQGGMNSSTMGMPGGEEMLTNLDF